MQIIQKAKNAPFVFNGHPQTFRTEYEKDKYIDQELYRWVNGYGNLTGKHYFYLTQIKIKKGTGGSMIRPIWRDVDQWIFEWIDEMENKGWFGAIFKRREIGLSSIGGCCLPNYYMHVNPGCTTVMTSADKAKLVSLFKDKFIPSFDAMDLRFRMEQGQRNVSQQGVYLSTKDIILNSEGQEESASSEMYCQETVKDPSALSGKRIKYAFLDEYPLHTRRTELLGSLEPCLEENGERTGFALLGGTVEAKIKGETLVDIRKFWQDSKNSKIGCFLVEGWMGLVMNERGESDREKGIEKIEKVLEERSQSQDLTLFYNYKKNYPLSWDDIFEGTGESGISRDIMEKLSRRKSELLRNPPPRRSLELEMDEQGIVRETNKKTGKIDVIESPIEGVVYRAGCDPIPFTSEGTTTNEAQLSKWSVWIKNTQTGRYVARYTERSHNIHEVCQRTVLLLEWYNDAKMMIERNQGSAPMKEMKRMGAWGRLANEPAIFRSIRDRVIEKGYSKHGTNSEHLYNAFINYLTNYPECIDWLEIIESAETFLTRNDDDMDAIIGCELFDQEARYRAEKKFAMKTTTEIPYYTSENGQRVLKFKTSVVEDGYVRGQHRLLGQ